jgi:hypothetical protein
MHGLTLDRTPKPFNPGYFSNCTSAKATALLQFDLGLQN